MVVLVSYDLRKPGKDYENLYSALRNVGRDKIRPLESLWLFDTVLGPQEIFDQIKGHIDSSDRVFVVRLTSNYQGWLDKSVWDWLKGKTF